MKFDGVVTIYRVVYHNKYDDSEITYSGSFRFWNDAQAFADKLHKGKVRPEHRPITVDL